MQTSLIFYKFGQSNAGLLQLAFKARILFLYTLAAEDISAFWRLSTGNISHNRDRTGDCLVLQGWGHVGGLLLWKPLSGYRNSAPSAAGRPSQSSGRSSGGQYGGNVTPRRQKMLYSPPHGNKLQRLMERDKRVGSSEEIGQRRSVLMTFWCWQNTQNRTKRKLILLAPTGTKRGQGWEKEILTEVRQRVRGDGDGIGVRMTHQGCC